MPNDPNILKAVLKSKKFSLTLGWTFFLLGCAWSVPRDQGVTLLQSASVVIAAYMIGQGISEGLIGKGKG